jgi:hypothetical protein
MNPGNRLGGGPGDRPAAHPAPGCQCPPGRHPRRRLGA